MEDAVSGTIAQLEAARQVVLSDATHYAAIIPGILPIIGVQAHLEVRRWGAEFLAEAFASPVFATSAKEALCIQILPTLREILDTPGQDEMVVKSSIRTAASIYGLVIRYITNNPQSSDIAALMSTIKANILRRFDSSSTSIRICCIKFILRVVQIQTPGLIGDPRKQEQTEISLAIVPRDHPLIPPPNLEAEASGLLDRLLHLFYEEQSDVFLVDATLNGLATLVKSRPSVANKIVSAVLNFNPFKGARPSLTPKDKVQIQSLERTTSAFLTYYSRKNPNSPLAGRIVNQLGRLKGQRLELFESRKRGYPGEPTDGIDNIKRQRLGDDSDSRPVFLPLPPGPVSVAQLYTLTEEEALKDFDVMPIPIDIVVKIAIPVLHRIDAAQLDDAINAIRARYLELSRHAPPPTATAAGTAGTAEEDEDDYEPDFEPIEDSEQIQNKLDAMPSAVDIPQVDLDLGPFVLPQPPPLKYEEAEQMGKGAISRVFTMMSHLDSPTKASKHGLNRLAGSSYDKEAWITVITRLATRASPDVLEDEENEDEEKTALQLPNDRLLGDGIRETLWKYIIQDFRHRIEIAIAWLNEEWYNDRIVHSQPDGMDSSPLKREHNGIRHPQHYEKWVLKVLDAIIPYLDANDKVLVRFLGEIPEVSETVLERVKRMARDPDRVTLAVKAIYYLVAFKPPTKEAAIDALEDLWRNYPDAKASVKPMLARVRPSVLADQLSNGIKKETSPSSASATPVPPPVAPTANSPAPPHVPPPTSTSTAAAAASSNGPEPAQQQQQQQSPSQSAPNAVAAAG